MTLLLAFLTLSFLASVLVLAACMLSSQISQDEGVEETYEEPLRGEWGEVL